MIVGLYKVKLVQTPDRGELKFYKQIGEADIEKVVPEITAKDYNNVEDVFVYDQSFSKEVGHYAYVKSNKSVLTPFVPDALPSGSE